MKTLNDLVNELNRLFGYGDFYIDKDDEMDSYTLYMKDLGTVGGLIELSKEYKSWIAQPSFGLASADVQKDIMDFIYTTDSNHWFDEPEKKYNIIVGRDLEPFAIQEWKAAYMKTAHGVKVWHASPEKDFINDEFIFTESEVEDLKSKVSEQSAKIIDLGKVEVKDENN